MQVSRADAVALVGACAWPAEAFWRIHELDIVRAHLPLAVPVLELGCGDGAFATLAGLRIALALDREPHAVARAARRTETYAGVAEVDLRGLDADELGTFETLFANSVLEHIADVEEIFPSLRGLLDTGGRLVTTVPLREMNSHLALPGARYAAWRQRQLEHRSLWSADEWREHLLEAGFASVEFHPYLDGRACQFWDRLDVVGGLGFGRYRLALVVHRLASRLLPRSVKTTLKMRIAGALLRRAGRSVGDELCAALVIAHAPA